MRRVVVHNRNDVATYSAFLGAFQVWVGSSPGQATAPSATLCGWQRLTATGGAPYTFTLDCAADAAQRPSEYVTLKQVGRATYLSIKELEVYGSLSTQQLAPPLPPALRASSPPPRPSPPSPPPPVVSDAGLQRIGAVLSSSFNAARYPAANAIDGQRSTLCASRRQTGAWLSVQVPRGSRIGAVLVYNRKDYALYQEWLGAFEIYVGSRYGDLATRCGRATGYAAGPYTVDCRGVSSGPFGDGTYVTLKQIGGARYLTIAELAVQQG